MNAIKVKVKTFSIGAICAMYVVMWVGGVARYILFSGSRSIQASDPSWEASVFLTLAGTLVIVTSSKRAAIRLFAAGLLGFAAEIIGVRYGFIFGPYRYTDALQPQILDTPLVMISAWMVLVSYCQQTFVELQQPRFIKAALAALFMTAIDLVIDPLAANQLGYWRWQNSGAYYGIPMQNFFGWMAVSFLIFSVIYRKPSKDPLEIRRPQDNWFVRYVGLSIVLFFTVIALGFKLALAGSIGLILCLTRLAVFWGKDFFTACLKGIASILSGHYTSRDFQRVVINEVREDTQKVFDDRNCP